MNPKVFTLHVSPAADLIGDGLAEPDAEEEPPLVVAEVEPLNSSLIRAMLTPVSFAHADPESSVAVLLKVISAH
jgi:hypothetical protein